MVIRRAPKYLAKPLLFVDKLGSRQAFHSTKIIDMPENIPIDYWFALRSMEYQKAIAILQSLLDRHSLNAEEKEAIMTAIGVLSWGALSESKMKSQKAKRDKSTEW